MNPEQRLEEVAIAIKHRCISSSMRWLIVYYMDRICCVPSYQDVPPKIILFEFTEQEVEKGFINKDWDRIQTAIETFYKELHK